MSISVLRTQQKTEGLVDSTTVGFLNPVWYLFKQYTGTYTAVVDSLGNIILSTPSTAGIEVGDQIQFAGGVYDGIVVGRVLSFVTDVSITIEDYEFLGDDSGYFINKTKYKQIHIQTRLLRTGTLPPDFTNGDFASGGSGWSEYAGGGTWVYGTGYANFAYAGGAVGLTNSKGLYRTGVFALNIGDVIRVDITRNSSSATVNNIFFAQVGTSTVISNVEAANTGTFYFTITQAVTAGMLVMNYDHNIDYDVTLISRVAVAGIPVSTYPSSWFGNPDMNVLVDISSELFSIFSEKDQLNYSNTHQQLMSSGIYSLQYREVYWDEDLVKQTGAWTDISEDVLALFGGKQIKEEYGNNYLEYINRSVLPYGKFLTRMINPVITRGYPYPVTFIIDPNNPVTDVLANLVWLPINQAPTISSEELILGDLDAGVWTLFTTTPPATAKYVAINLEQGVEISMTAYKTYKIVDYCPGMVVIEWKNKLGGFDQYPFHNKNSPVEILSQEKEVTKRYEYDIENSNGSLSKAGSNKRFSITVSANYVDMEDVPFLHEIKSSEQVRVVFPDLSTINVVVTQLTTPIQAGAKKDNFSITLRFPDDFDPTLIDPTLI